MSNYVEQFNKNKYVHLENFLAAESCVELVSVLKKLVQDKKTEKDTQCPLSEAVHGAPAFDSLLEQLLPNFEEASGKKLYPTYSYARLYAPGDELKIHTDRASCEISATITLGFDGDVWPIYMADYGNEVSGKKVRSQHGDDVYITNESKISMKVGDAVLYRGMDKVHWREKYTEGTWQAQVFLHYVDANGPNAEWKYDKRPNLSHHEEIEYLFWHFPDAMTKDSCQKVIESLEAQTDGEEAKVGGNFGGVINKEIRDVKKVQLPVHRGIGATMAGMGLLANSQAWNFDILQANQCEYLRYDNDGHYLAHIDTYINPKNKTCRKLTILIFLNDDFEGGKFFIQNGHDKIYPPQSAGTCLVFPSFMLHGVEPVTKGIRRSVVTWLVGPWFK